MKWKWTRANRHKCVRGAVADRIQIGHGSSRAQSSQTTTPVTTQTTTPTTTPITTTTKAITLQAV